MRTVCGRLQTWVGTALLASAVFLMTASLGVLSGAVSTDQTRGTFLLHLDRGWNLVSLPVQPQNPDCATLLPAANRRAGVWRHVPGAEDYRSVTRLDPFTGYWIYAPRPVAIRVPGLLAQPARVVLALGWNLIGPATELPVARLPDGVRAVWRWDVAARSYERETGALQPGEGYWVQCGTIPCELQLDSGDEDADSDGLRDVWESGYGTTPASADSDMDGLSDFDELFVFGTDPAPADTDGDGLQDGWERDRAANGFDPVAADTDGDGVADGDNDWDGDELTNAREQELGTDPCIADTDGDGIRDWLDQDPCSPGLNRVRVLHLRAGWNAQPLSLAPAAAGPESLLQGLALGDVRAWGPDDQDWIAVDRWRPQRGYLFWGNAPEQGRFVVEPVRGTLGLELGPGWNLISTPLTVQLPAARTWIAQEVNAAPDRLPDPDSAVTELQHDRVYWLQLPAAFPPGTAVDLNDWLNDQDRDRIDDDWEQRELGRSQPDALGGADPDGDADKDGLSNYAEYRLHTCPLRADSDGDTLSDGYEVAHDLVAAAIEAPCTVRMRFEQDAASAALANSGTDTTIHGAMTGVDAGPECGPGILGDALRFAPATGLELRNSAAVFAAESFSISLWAALRKGGRLFAVPAAAGRGAISATVDIFGTLTITFGDSLLVLPFGLLDERWHHLLISVNGNTATLYADGASADSVTLATGYQTTAAAADLEIGAGCDAAGVAGYLDDLRLYRSALQLDAAMCLFQPAGDTDGDGLSDLVELQLCTQPNAADTDDDGADDGAETLAGTDPNRADSDGDGMADGWELQHGLDPTAADAHADPDGDGRDNARELADGSDPQTAETGSALVEFETDSTVTDEAAGSVSVTLRLQGDPVEGTTVKAVVDLAGGSATAGVDYQVALPAVLTLTPTRRRALLEILLVADTAPEPEEVIVLEISQARAAGLGAIATHRIVIRDRLGPNTDQDGDGLPDAWEQRYFGDLQAAAEDDPDGDGECNRREYRLGRHPAAGVRAVPPATVGLEVHTLLH